MLKKFEKSKEEKKREEREKKKKKDPDGKDHTGSATARKKNTKKKERKGEKEKKKKETWMARTIVPTLAIRVSISLGESKSEKMLTMLSKITVTKMFSMKYCGRLKKKNGKEKAC